MRNKILKYILILFIILVGLSLSACSKSENIPVEKNKDEINTEEKELSYIKTAREINDLLYSKDSFNVLENELENRKDLMSEKVYSENFDMSKFTNQSKFEFGADVEEYNTVEVFKESLKDGSVNVIFINELFLLSEQVVNEVSESNPFYMYIFNVYTFEDGIITNYKQYSN